MRPAPRRLRCIEDGGGRYTLEKAGPGRLIDACIASVLAYEASVVAGPGAFVIV